MRVVIDFFESSELRTKYMMLVKELKEYEHKQVQLFLDGKKSSPRKIANACLLMEDGCYMREYIGNENGSIAEIHFDKVLDEPNMKKPG